MSIARLALVILFLVAMLVFYIDLYWGSHDVKSGFMCIFYMLLIVLVLMLELVDEIKRLEKLVAKLSVG